MSGAVVEGERMAPVNGIELAYDERGDPGGEPMVLVMGLGTQLIHWDERFCRLLGDRGYRLIRFDNRDAGRSTALDPLGVPSTASMLLGLPAAPYSLADMAADTVGLMDHLDIERAHLVGASMGGMVAQTAALRSPERVLSLASMLSTTGNRRLGIPKWRTFGTLMAKPPREREAYGERMVRVFRAIGSPGFPQDNERIRALSLAAYDRGHHPGGVARQLHAITSSGDRTRALRELELPAVIIHGREDPLVRVMAGRATAKAIPGARLRVFEGMGHDLPPPLWSTIAAEIADNAARASASAGGLAAS